MLSIFGRGKASPSKTNGDNRKEPREEVREGSVRIYRERYPLKDWSRSGFLTAPCALGLDEGKELNISVSVTLAKKRLDFDCKAVVVRANDKNEEVACLFVMIDRGARIDIDQHFGVFLQA